MLSEHLKKYRQEHGLTQIELAQVLFISQNTVSQYEAGKRTPSVKKIATIAGVLNCSIDDLLKRDSYDNPA